MWTSSSNKCYITVTGHFIYEFQSYTVVLATNEVQSSHTGENISNAILDILNNYEIDDKVVTVVTDNAENVKKAVSKGLKISQPLLCCTYIKLMCTRRIKRKP